MKNRHQTKEKETNEKFLHNLSSHQLTDSKVSLLSRGLKFIPTPATIETRIKQQLLRDFEQFARRIRLLYVFHRQNREPHPFHVKSTWMPHVQHSVALESYLENVKTQLAEIKIIKPRNNLSRKEVKALKELKINLAINLKKNNNSNNKQRDNDSYLEQGRQNIRDNMKTTESTMSVSKRQC